ncbi:hypothetical protein [Ulvibacterium sp.]|uniref:hypothetical protein n=1 Tax=Ulvibacterium sp. TaxID=2665914 RepID=UPI003CC671B0
MTTKKNYTAYIFAFTFVGAITFIYTFIAIALVPYWQELSGTEIQSWWSGPFTRFSNIMVPLHILSIITMVYAFIKNRKESNGKVLWLITLITLLICQGFNFGLYGGIYNPALQSGALEAQEALSTFDDWDFYHTVRTIFVCVSLVTLIIIGLTQKAKINQND